MIRRPKQRGYALIEMLLVISGIAVLFGLSVGMIHMLLRLDRGNRSRLGEKATISRLAHQFRRDAHAAVDVRPIEGAKHQGLALVFDDGGTIEYVDEGGRLARVESSAGETLRQETFRLPSRDRPKVELREADGRRWGRLVLAPKPQGKEIEPPRTVLIEAWVGKDQRFSRPKERAR